MMDTPEELTEIVLPQTVVGPLTRAAIFLVTCSRSEQDNYATLRSFCAGLSGLIRAVEFRTGALRVARQSGGIRIENIGPATSSH